MNTIEKKKALCSLFVWGISYLLTSILLLVSSHHLMNLLSDVILSCGMLLAIVAMWYCYKKGLYRQARLLWIIPFPLFAFLMLLE